MGTFLEITAAGHVLTDTDSTNFFGFGISPDPVTMQPNTAAGIPTTFSFMLDLSRTPPLSSGNPHRADYFTNQLPAADWVGWTGLVGTHVLPELSQSQVGWAELWTAYGTLPVFNEFLVNSIQTNGSGFESSTLRIDSATTPFLHGLGLNQTFSWNPSMDDGISVVEVEQYTNAGQLISHADIRIDSLTEQIISAPEPSILSLAALGLILILVFQRRRRADGERK